MRFTNPTYSKRQIVEAGKLLRETLVEPTEEVMEAFRVAHNWRAAHAYPMHCVRHELRGKIRRGGGGGLTAARVKRMASIRRKLMGSPVTLYQMQDLAGIRAILPDGASVERVRGTFDEGETVHRIQRVNDYIAEPKASGYRSLHLILKFQEENGAGAFDRLTVEVQLRTRLQHAWATAVEAVGLVRGEHIKGGEGSESWGRFFALMAGEIAAHEGGAAVPGVPEDVAARRAELRAVDEAIGAIRELDGLNEGLAASEELPTVDAYFLLRFDRAQKRVTVRPYWSSLTGARAYDAADGFGASGTDVLIEVDKVADLRAAYPNYFLDVRHFLEFCWAAVEGRSFEVDAHRERTDLPEPTWFREYDRLRKVRRQ